MKYTEEQVKEEVRYQTSHWSKKNREEFASEVWEMVADRQAGGMEVEELSQFISDATSVV